MFSHSVFRRTSPLRSPALPAAVRTLRVGALASLLFGLPAVALANEQPRDLSRLSLEDLMRLEITSAARREQRIEAVPAAVHVITAEDIRRSGMTSLPDVLRLAPGVHVGQGSANKWSVSIRGFNGFYATKLLVLVDGRPVYNRLFAGVLWDLEDIILDEVERIEIIRGPGGAMWGTNAVNGVVNIVMKAPAVASGTVVRIGGGSFDEAAAAVSHDGSVRGTGYRLFSRWARRGSSLLNGKAVGDETESWRSGFRIERGISHGSLLLDGQLSRGWHHPLWLEPSSDVTSTRLLGGRSDVSSGALIARLTKRAGDTGSFQVQASYEGASRREPIGRYDHKAGDIDIQYRTSRGRHDVVFGSSHRQIDESLHGTHGFSLHPSRSRESIFSAFAQDEISLGETVTLSLGARAEKDTGFEWELQPTARAIWNVGSRQRLWGAVSRAVRMPSLQERGIEVRYPPMDIGAGLPLVATFRGNAAMEPESLVSTEAGYRASAHGIELDVAGFVSRYSNLRSSEVSPPELQFGAEGPFLGVLTRFDNFFAARTSGVEAWARGRVIRGWRAEAGATVFHLTPRPDARTQDPNLATFDGATPRFQAFARSSWTAGPHDLDVFVTYVGRLRRAAVPAYTRMDVRLQRRLSDALSIALVAQNLLDGSHVESDATDSLQLATEIPRSAVVQLRWRIR